MKLANFYDYKSYRWFWINLFFLAILTGVYFWDDPAHGASGGTVLGYTYGVIAALGIVYLMWFGIRKRAYHTSGNTLQACLSAHTWIGIALLFIVPLHCGFQFGCNIHTLAYVFMVIVIVSGIWGAINYTTLANKIQSHRGGATVPKLLSQIYLLADEMSSLAKDKSDTFQSLRRQLDFEFRPSISKALFGKLPAELPKQQTTELLATLPATEQSDGLKLIGLVEKKRDLATRSLEEVAILTKLRAWLFIHVPVSLALVVALVVHIFSVFYYR